MIEKIEEGETPEDALKREIVKGDLMLKEHDAARWLDKENIYSVEWLPADLSLIERIALRP